jgi:P27 family predicted phage terminase small subunit
MMGRGRKPTPTEIKKLNGNPGHRALNNKEPKPDIVAPECPAHLKGEARLEWKRLTTQLIKLGLAAECDRAALAICCTAYADYVKACKKLEKEGEVIVTDKMNLVQNPWMQIKKRSMDQVIKSYAEFGLTPSSRSRVHVDKPSEEDELEKMLFGRGVRVGK